MWGAHASRRVSSAYYELIKIRYCTTDLKATLLVRAIQYSEKL